LIDSKANIIGWLVPLAELAIVVLLFFISTRSLGLKASFTLMILFTFYIGYMLIFTPHLPCSCGGVLRQLSWKNHLIFNLGLTLLAGWGVWLMNKKRSFASSFD
jgi:hypothetical protein